MSKTALFWALFLRMRCVDLRGDQVENRGVIVRQAGGSTAEGVVDEALQTFLVAIGVVV